MPKLIKLLLVSISLLMLVGASNDRGLGGTGKATVDDRGLGGTGLADDRGLGGTGIIGTITEFGSIWVNGLEIELDEHTLITIDGKKANETDLRLGQQVAVLSHKVDSDWFAKEIQIQHALIGEVEEVTDDSLTILGEAVFRDPKAPGNWPNISIGDRLAVSGYFFNGAFYSTDVSREHRASSTNWQLSSLAYLDNKGNLRLGNKRLPSGIGIQAGDKVTITQNGIEKVTSQKVFGRFANSYLIEGRKPDRDKKDTEIDIEEDKPNQRDIELSAKSPKPKDGNKNYDTNPRTTPEERNSTPKSGSNNNSKSSKKEQKTRSSRNEGSSSKRNTNKQGREKKDNRGDKNRR
ncbi:hypothetical protein GV054_01680 [Marinomonas mediterranea]|uniref:DUF5666 domain-containing protein n=1 Tax=Marinomonas mediterranea (strain ATCC 700492 / JCM 21426 / NBRC 103028 / MMB-1) TaxID=717774 RepID=F2JXX9_MARM1|nr:DUF5666 domain-containing protein [Marinomonas mediterranea]ADZ89628.1 hypothetical protein Marme_0325 [Marinomonas mediterranea MMB-1]WCN11820.1 hypothetical protein GV054_01680 [Marinomonas mediterranea]WCN15868.1 hypothetical protein GV053_01645 [Marinomonas mediterranea MMB-1]